MKLKKLACLAALSFACVLPMSLTSVQANAADVASIEDADDLVEGQKFGDCFTVKAKQGATVSFGDGTVLEETTPDKTEDSYDYYYFQIPAKLQKKGGTRTVVAELNGAKTELKVTCDKMETKKVDHTVILKAKYNPAAAGCEFGNLELEMNSKKADGMYYHVKELNGHGLSGKIMFADTDADDWDDLMKPLIREGATVIVHSAVMKETVDGTTQEVRYSASKRESEGPEILAKAGCTSTTLNLKVVDTKYKNKVKEAKIRIPKQKNAPKIKIDTVKGTISMKASMQFQFAKYEENDQLGRFTAWADGKSKMKLTDVSGAAIIASGGCIKVRVKATNKAVPSKITTITLPSMGAIDVSKIEASGECTATGASVKISDFNKESKPYEYTLSAPSASTKWITPKNGTIEFKGKKALADGDGVKVWIREKAINATKTNPNMKVASNIMCLKYTKEGKVWTKEYLNMSEFLR